MIPEPSSVSREEIVPTIVTSRPSRIHTVPSPISTIQCQRAHGSRSSRAGIFVSMMRPSVMDSVDMSLPLLDCQAGVFPQALSR